MDHTLQVDSDAVIERMAVDVCFHEASHGRTGWSPRRFMKNRIAATEMAVATTISSSLPT